MSFTSDEGGFLKPLLEEETADDAGSGAKQATTPRRSPPPSQVMLRKTTQRYGEKSFYNKHSQWAANDRRSVYMNDLLLQRQQAINNIFPGEDQDEEEGGTGGGGVRDSAQQISNKMHAAFIHNLKSFVEGKGTSVLPSVEIRVRNFSFDAPIHKSWFKKMKESFSRKKVDSVKEVKSVLKNVNLALEPGKMYLIIGPPSSGKTSLLNGKTCLCVC
jgi:ABC-type multidrug transport system fused ATPase/permease subunit